MKYVKVMVTVTILAVLGVLIYFHFSNIEPKNNDDEDELSVVAELISKNLDENYPATAREVVIYFNNIQKCYYNEDINEDELLQLATIARELFDTELLEENVFEDYYRDLKEEISEYKKNKRVITKIVVDKGSDVEYITVDGVKNATLKVCYYLKDTRGNSKIVENYILKKDSDGRWKIYGWGEAGDEE